jgi:hypothetical protein
MLTSLICLKEKRIPRPLRLMIFALSLDVSELEDTEPTVLLRLVQQPLVFLHLSTTNPHYYIEEAVRQGNLSVVQHLYQLNPGCLRPDLVYSACTRGHLSVLKFLVEKQTTVDLNLALCMSQDLPVVKYLVDCGADVNARRGEPMNKAISFDAVEVAEFLHSRGAELQYRHAQQALLFRNLAVFRFLVEHGVGHRDRLLRLAEDHGVEEAVEYLRRH